MVIWGGEFGRTPFFQGKIVETKTRGRDHHPCAFTRSAGGPPVRTHRRPGPAGRLPALPPVLHLLGIDHERLTYKFQGRHYRLTDVHGHVVKEIVA
jgi:hypothetical protein